MREREEHIRRILDEVRERCVKAGRRPEEVRVMAVTKLHGPEAIADAYRAGIRLFGENRLQEAASKREAFPPDAELHLIGHLQRNKARKAVELFSCIHSVDRIPLIEALEKAWGDRGGRLPVLVEVNISGEETKYGFRTEEEVGQALERLAASPALEPRGFMTMAPYTDDERVIRAVFGGLRELASRMQKAFPSLPLAELSMGMSNDYPIAIEEGSTILRLGTVLFGERAP
ncbi:YggS family pyridoxal phosphate-dependent enzyme [Spirochaeta thermophila]|uniref:Pyridoxal phosphate homeostasis protein n=1 Tax=Winmispira thermophila (strain ATCC 49972 / DSM 6192 / RI 19.B1) TaxID=665571 RepID=E0RNY4_WINT6|nr:YggS family pyridoxal phosphate-dependent enzyme [Spirochaeta thermophila]ADN02646.1 predicted pyridoxal 5'-phosphate-dependent enzyme [Spirochaeta thermophila DSM 6192]